MVFGGGILGGARKIWGNPYLNSTTVLFDMITFMAIVRIRLAKKAKKLLRNSAYYRGIIFVSLKDTGVGVLNL